MRRYKLMVGGVCVLVCWMMNSSRVVAADQCFVCHDAIGGKPALLFKGDIHRQKGVSCAGCHGGDASTDDMDRAMSKAAGFTGIPRGDDISKVCAGCHAHPEAMAKYHANLPTNQFPQLNSSAHGALSVTGKEHIAQCTTCHNAHGIVSVKSPASPVHPLRIVATCTKCHNDAAYMRTYNPSLRVDQLGEYRTSVHGKRNVQGDVKAAECASCHGSHAILPASDMNSSISPVRIPFTCSRCHSDAQYMQQYGIPTDQYEKYSRSVHGVALLQRHDPGAPACNSCHGNHGATPPGVKSVSKVCGTCHALNADLFASSPHKKAFDEMGLPECSTCHGNHEIVAATDSLLGTGPDAACSQCHSMDEYPAGYRVAATMRALIDSLEQSDQEAHSLVDEAEQKGMEISEEKFKLRDVRQARLEARTAVHAFSVEKFHQVVDKGLSTSSTVSTEARLAIEEYSFRRLGLGVATLIISVVAISVYLYIRRVEKHRATRGAPAARV
jgi:hypothetical protein